MRARVVISKGSNRTSVIKMLMYSVSTKSLRGFEKLWRANKLN
jgi:hypothetical protein